MRLLLGAAAAVFIAACGSPPPSPAITFIDPPAPSAVEVRGLPARDIQALSTVPLTTEQWQEILRVQVRGSTGPGIAGTYKAENGVVRFTPMFGFDKGRQFIVTFNATRIPGTAAGELWRQPRLQRIMTVAGAAAERTTVVSQVYPRAPQLPENMLRFYIEFSGPMGRGGALEHIRLVEDGGNEVVDPFLPVAADFWNPERTRFTLFFDPGRVKRGIKPNRDLGRALVSGKRYALIISDRWLDARGQPLKEEYRHAFTAGPAAEAPLDTATWKIHAPSAVGKNPLLVTFPSPLDRGLLVRAIGVQREGVDVKGDVRIEGNETRWEFRPAAPWAPGNYTLVVLTLLEDPSGNRIGRAFESRSVGGEKRDAIQIAFAVK